MRRPICDSKSKAGTSTDAAASPISARPAPCAGLPLLSHARQGQVEHLTLKIGAVDKTTTGYQLAITLPDKATESSLKDFYGSVLNGGAINDQKGFDFGNETDGWYYAGSCWMYGAALAAGTPAAGQLSAHPYDAARAFREHLAHVLSTLDEQGRAHFGYNQGGEWVDDNLHTIIGHALLPASQWRRGTSSGSVCPRWNACSPTSSNAAIRKGCSSSTTPGPIGTTIAFPPAA